MYHPTLHGGEIRCDRCRRFIAHATDDDRAADAEGEERTDLCDDCQPDPWETYGRAA